ncbi:MAG: DUF3857 domain-containing protein [Acidobacteriota bacterium]
MRHRFMFLFSFLLVAPFAFAAKPAAGWKPVTPEDLRLTAKDLGDAEADAAILFREGVLNDDDNQGTSLRLYIRIKIFNDRGRRFADIELPYKKELGKITDVSARTIKPDGTIIEVADRDIFDKLIFKSSTRTERAKVFTLSGVEPGTIIEYRYRQTYPQGFRYFAFDLQSELFIKQLSYTIQTPFMTNADVRWVTFNVKDEKRFHPAWDGAFKINVEDIHPFKREPMMPPELAVKMWGWLYYSTELEQKPEKYWRDYARRMYYRALGETTPSKAIRQVVASITNPTDSPQDKLAKLYKYVQNEIRNLGDKDKADDADPEGAESSEDFKKNDTADDTLKRRYGTPREINRLFVAMARAAGFEARVIELVTRDENLFHQSFTDAFQFNGEAAVIINRDGALQFFDAGTAYCPAGSLAWEKEAVTALLYGDKDWRFVETPVSDGERNNEDRKLRVTPFADGRVEVQVESKVTGLRALELRNELQGLTREEQRKRILSAARDRLPSATINESSVTISDAVKPPSALSEAYHLTLPQAATVTEKRLFLKPALLTRRDENFLPSATRANNLRFHFAWSESEQAVIETPDGYEIEQVPEAIEVDIGAARYQAKFTRAGDHIIYERKLLVNGINFTPKQYAIVKTFFDRVHQSDRALISFKQK